MSARTAIAFMVVFCLVSSQSLAGLAGSVDESGEQRAKGTAVIQAGLLGERIALIASSVVFDKEDVSIDTYWVQDGTGGYIEVPTQVGADTKTMFWTGAAFMARVGVAAVRGLGNRSRDHPVRPVDGRICF